MKFRDNLPEAGTQNFLKLKDGESVSGVFMGEPHEFFQTWKDKQPTIVPEGTAGAKFRFRINFITKDKTGYVPKIFEQGVTVYRDLKALHDEYNLESVVVKITRHGSGLNDTTYSLMPSLKNQVTPDIRAVKLLSLATEKQDTMPVESHDFGPPPFDNNDEIPF